MNHLQFTRQEIDRLVEMRAFIQNLLDKMEKENLFPNKVHPELFNNNHKAFFKRRAVYERRSQKYAHQLFYIVRKADWEKDLQKWINKICPEKEVNEHHFLDLSCLHVHLHNIIFYQYPSNTEPTIRMINALLTEQGYEDGFAIIQELYLEEENEEIKSKLAERIKRFNVFSPFKNQLVKIVQTDVRQLETWTKSNELTTSENYEILRELNSFLDHFEGLKNRQYVEDEVDRVLERLWEEKTKE